MPTWNNWSAFHSSYPERMDIPNPSEGQESRGSPSSCWLLAEWKFIRTCNMTTPTVICWIDKKIHCSPLAILPLNHGYAWLKDEVNIMYVHIIISKSIPTLHTVRCYCHYSLRNGFSHIILFSFKKVGSHRSINGLVKGKITWKYGLRDWELRNNISSVSSVNIAETARRSGYSNQLLSDRTSQEHGRWKPLSSLTTTWRETVTLNTPGERRSGPLLIWRVKASTLQNGVRWWQQNQLTVS